MKPTLETISKIKARAIYAGLLRCRKFEEKIAEVYAEKEMRCPVHLSIGQEASAVGVCAALGKEDMVFSTHRCHSHVVAKGADLKPLMAELYGKVTGCCRGKGGSMHLLAPEVGMFGSSAIVGGTLPLALGTAMASHLQKKPLVSVAFFGDGAMEQGTFHESLNFAALHKLPMIFVCENNRIATCTLLEKRQAARELYKHAEVYGMFSELVDGRQVQQVYEAGLKAVERARSGQGPSLIEVTCYRWKEHVGPNTDYHLGHRSKEELEEWMAKDPILLFERFAIDGKWLSASEIQQISTEIQTEVEDALVYAKQSPFPNLEELYTDL